MRRHFYLGFYRPSRYNINLLCVKLAFSPPDALGYAVDVWISIAGFTLHVAVGHWISSP